MTLYIFDKDGTLVRFERRFLRAPTPTLKVEDQVLLPGVFEKLAQLRAEGHHIAIASNQPMVAAGQISLAEAQQLMENCAAKVGGVSAFRFSPFSPHAQKVLHGRPNPYARDDESRKPRPGMILELMAELQHTPADTVMVGNAKTDRQTAKAAGVRFQTAKKFFQPG